MDGPTESKLKDKQKLLKEATSVKDVDAVLKNVKQLDNICSFKKCKANVGLFAIDCKYCQGRFCTSHGLPEIHGCGEAVRRDEKREYLHPKPKLTNEKHDQAQTKLNTKLRQMQQERKTKGGKSKK